MSEFIKNHFCSCNKTIDIIVYFTWQFARARTRVCVCVWNPVTKVNGIFSFIIFNFSQYFSTFPCSVPASLHHHVLSLLFPTSQVCILFVSVCATQIYITSIVCVIAFGTPTTSNVFLLLIYSFYLQVLSTFLSRINLLVVVTTPLLGRSPVRYHR